MTVRELIEHLQQMPQDKVVVMFDGPASFTPSKVYVCDWYSEDLNGTVIID